MAQGHKGTIYQAYSFTYLGETFQAYLKVNGRVVHPRTLNDRYRLGGQSLDWLRKHADPRAKRVEMPAKHSMGMGLIELVSSSGTTFALARLS